MEEHEITPQVIIYLDPGLLSRLLGISAEEVESIKDFAERWIARKGKQTAH